MCDVECIRIYELQFFCELFRTEHFDGDVLYSIRFLNTLIKENNKAYCVKHSRQIIKMAKRKHTPNGNIVFVNCEYVYYELTFVNVSK